MKLQAINLRHQKTLERAYKASRRYAEAVNLDKSDRVCEAAFSRYQELIDDLPRRELRVLQRFHFEKHGYGA